MDFVFLVPLPPHYIWRQTWDRRATEGPVWRLNQIRDLDEARDYWLARKTVSTGSLVHSTTAAELLYDVFHIFLGR